MRHSLSVLLVIAVTLTFVGTVLAASHAEITVVPIGPVSLVPGEQKGSYRLPLDGDRWSGQPVVFLGQQPLHSPAPAEDEGPMVASPEEESPPKMVPATITFTVAGHALPPWHLTEQATAYVIDVDKIGANPEFRTNRLAMTIQVETSAEKVYLTALGMPDPTLLDKPTSGTYAQLAKATTDPDVRDYFDGVQKEIIGEHEAARQVYDRLRTSANPRVGRLARRGLRMLSYQLRQRKLSGNFMEHYRWGLYLQQCGLFAPAFDEYEECRIIYPAQADAQLRAGEMLDHIGSHIDNVLHYIDRAFEATPAAHRGYWSILVIIVKSRGNVTLTPDQIVGIKNNWLAVEKIIQAVSERRIQFDTAFFDVEDEKACPLTTYPGGIVGPKADIIEEKGWFQSVILVQPRLSKEAGKAPLTIGGDKGPKGVALSSLFADASWQDYIEAWYRQFSWAATNGNAGVNIPTAEEALGVGHRPIPHRGYGCRAVLRDLIPPEVFRRVSTIGVVDLCPAVQLWRVQGSSPLKKNGGSKEPATLQAREIVIADAFLDLSFIFPKDPPSQVKATSWVYCPEDREVRMWLATTHPLSVKINGRLMYDGTNSLPAGELDKSHPDSIASHAFLQKGWNELEAVTDRPSGTGENNWGFSVRFAQYDERPIPGYACVFRRPDNQLVGPYTPPKVGVYYSWPVVKRDYANALPALSVEDLQNITGIKHLSMQGEIQGTTGYFTLSVLGIKTTATYLTRTQPWQVGKDRDFVLNNVLDWEREACAVLRFAKDGTTHDLLLVKPEAMEAYIHLLNEPPAVAAQFNSLPPSDRVLGYVRIPVGQSSRVLFVLDTLLAEPGKVWPQDEEDCITPYPPKHVMLETPEGPLPQGPKPQD